MPKLWLQDGGIPCPPVHPAAPTLKWVRCWNHSACCSAEDGVIPARGHGLIKTDLAIAAPPGTYGRVAPRSGLAVKHGIATGAGVVDEDYRGALGIVLFNHSDTEFKGETAGADKAREGIGETEHSTAQCSGGSRAVECWNVETQVPHCRVSCPVHAGVGRPHGVHAVRRLSARGAAWTTPRHRFSALHLPQFPAATVWRSWCWNASSPPR